MTPARLLLFFLAGAYNGPSPPPPDGDFRITDAGDFRVTDAVENRITDTGSGPGTADTRITDADDARVTDDDNTRVTDADIIALSRPIKKTGKKRGKQKNR